jgi:hypothetical protein
MPGYEPYVANPESTKAIQQVLRSEPEKLASGYASYVSSGVAPPASKVGGNASQSPAGQISSAYMQMSGEDKDGDQRAQAIVDQAKLVRLSTKAAEYERADPRHRIGELLIAAWRIYLRKPEMRTYGPTKNPKDFFSWLDAIPEWDRIVMLSKEIRDLGTRVQGTPAEQQLLVTETLRPNLTGVKHDINLKPSVVAAFLKGVKYLDAASRPSYVVSFVGDRAMYRNALLDTRMMQTVFSGVGFAIWVMDRNGTIYAGKHIYGQMHHSSFLSGASVLAAGEVKAKNGIIEFLSGKSGHYQPPIHNLIEALKRLQLIGINLANLRVLVWGAPGSANRNAQLLYGDAVVNDAGKSYIGWGPLSLEQQAILRAGRYNEFR